jgi:hypothetical protein
MIRRIEKHEKVEKLLRVQSYEKEKLFERLQDKQERIDKVRR